MSCWLKKLSSLFHRLRAALVARRLGSERAGQIGLLMFDHIPKTGGTTFHSVYLPLAFAPDEIFLLGGMALDGERDRSRFVKMPLEQRKRIRIVAGHGIEPLRTSASEARFLSIARDPVQRVTSAYLHAVHHPHWRQLYPSPSNIEDFLSNFGPAASWFATGDPQVDRIVADGPQAIMALPNLQSRLLLGADYAILSDKQIEQRLARRYFAIGTTDKYPEFLFYLHRRLRFPLALFNKALVRLERSSLALTTSELDLIRRANLVDIRLYEIIKRRFERQFRAAVSAGDVTICTRYRCALELFSELTEDDVRRKVVISNQPVTPGRMSAVEHRLHNLRRDERVGQTVVADLEFDEFSVAE